MKRYLGSAVFEGVEVADSDFEDLASLREEEASDVEDAIWSYESDLEYLIDETQDDIEYLAEQRDEELYSRKDEYAYEIALLTAYYAPSFTPTYYVEVSFATSDYYADCADINEDFNDEYDYIISESEDDQDSLWLSRDWAINYAHDSATSQINAIINARYFLPVYMINNKSGACAACVELNKTVGTLSVLIEKRLIPPFHYHCRCFLSYAGYVVMSGTTPFVISELLSEAASKLGVSPSALVPRLPSAEEPSFEAEKVKWLAQIADWWDFWATYYPAPAEPLYIFHG